MPQILTVADYLKLVNDTLALIPSEEVLVLGEISDYRVSQGKWINFDLKDEEQEAKISCFATTFQVNIPIENGMKVQVSGSPKVYERFGKFSLNVRSIDLVGEGALAKAYEMLKNKLATEGLFDVGRKRIIPRFPSRIGLITSSDAAAYGDFLRILNNRWSGVEVVHIPVYVQGQHAVSEIITAFETFEALAVSDRPDCIVLTRGGGSLEDLHAFNDEAVARAVFKSSIPVIVGVGHERDESLCDFVADVRASTPSNAAEIVVPDRAEILREIEMSATRMEDVINMELERRARKVDHSVSVLDRFIERKVRDLESTIERFSHSFDRFRLSLISTRQYIERNQEVIQHSFMRVYESAKQSATSTIRLFESFDVQKVLERGYCIVRKGAKAVQDASKLDRGDEIKVQLARGTIDAEVK
ncbi:MAG: exodeoxyribonuclease VII large subunit [Candidatus Uhrbacteria bacterium]|nr:exodeoxyribonuclease VII large subunit [Candidatus Uhrbacteria bacterium]